MKNVSQKFHHVYILQSINFVNKYYTGLTEDISERLLKHNEGGVKYTAPYKPWRIKTVISFTDKDKARDFEKYLKTQSGRAFAKKRL